jgi:hypothetical protein
MRISLTKLGGVVGVPRRPIVVDTDDLPRAADAELRRLVEEANVLSLPEDIGGRGEVDRTAYTIEVEDGARRKTVCFDYACAGEPLRNVVAALKRAAADRKTRTP